MGDHLKTGVAKPSQIVVELFCLVVPTDGANYSLLDFLSQWIVRALTCQHVPGKQIRNGGGAPAASPMPKSDQGI